MTHPIRVPLPYHQISVPSPVVGVRSIVNGSVRYALRDASSYNVDLRRYHQWAIATARQWRERGDKAECALRLNMASYYRSALQWALIARPKTATRRFNDEH